MIVRQLVALLGVKSDKGDFDKAEGGMQRLIGFAKAAAAAFAAFKLGQWMKSAAEQTAILGDKFDKMSLRLGMSAQALQEWSLVADLAGTSINAVEVSLRRLQMATDEAASGSAEYADEFKRLGINVKGADGLLKSVNELLPEIGDGFKNLKTHTERTAVAQKLLGRSGTALIPVLMQGGDAIRAQREEVEALGAMMDEEFIKTSTEYIDNQARMQRITMGLKLVIGKALLPVMVKLQDVFIEWYKANRKWIAQKIGPIFKAIGQALGRVARAMGQTIDRIVEWGKKLDPMQSKLLKIGLTVAAIAGLLMLPGGAILLLIGLIGLLIDDFLTWQEGGDSAIGRIQEALKELLGFDIIGGLADWWKGIKDTIEFFIFNIMAFVQFLYDIFDKGIAKAWANLASNLEWIWKDVVRTLAEIWDWFADQVKLVFTTLGRFFTYYWNSIIAWFVGIWDWLVSWVEENVVTPIADFFRGLWEGFKADMQAVADFFTGIWEGITGFFSDTVDSISTFFSDLWTGIVDGFKSAWKWVLDGVKGFLTGLWDGITGVLSGLWDTITGWASDIIDAIAAPFKAIGEWIGDLFESEEEEAAAKAQQMASDLEARKRAEARRAEQRKQALGGLEAIVAAGAKRELRGPGQAVAAAPRGPIVHSPQTNVSVAVKAAPGMSEDGLARAIATQVAAKVEKDNRAAIRALTPMAASGT